MAVNAEWLHFAQLIILSFSVHLSNLVSLDVQVQKRRVTTDFTLTPVRSQNLSRSSKSPAEEDPYHVSRFLSLPLPAWYSLLALWSVTCWSGGWPGVWCTSSWASPPARSRPSPPAARWAWRLAGLTSQKGGKVLFFKALFQLQEYH